MIHFKSEPRFGPRLYAMVPFPIAGDWRLVAQFRYLGNGADPKGGKMVTAAFEVRHILFGKLFKEQLNKQPNKNKIQQ